MTEAAQKILAALSPQQLKKASMDFDNPARLDWHNIPKPERKGLQIREMSPEQRVLCHNLLQAALSESGYEKAVRIMSLENNLFVGEGKGAMHLRDPERYFLTIFGKPAHDSTWGWSFEGHHLSLNFVVKNDQVIGDTPSFWGANPATVKIFVEKGPEVGVRTLADEEQLAFDLVNSLTAEQKKKAIIAEKAPAEYRNGGNPVPPVSNPPEGIAGSDLTEAQQKTLWSLLETYNSHLADDVAAVRLDEIKDSGLNDVHFAWLGATQPGIGHSYRVQGPAFVLELINVQSDPAGNPANHIHSVWRSLKREFGEMK
ncbi:DUF3500 domain-containing protein [Planctomicrobium sp. SH661]|uniref:DUF3500 domain-containing protein n=1 Tax=Planctomicrobium sp. SH661 TaxID=3448124 RepID=UPI003F5B2D7F